MATSEDSPDTHRLPWNSPWGGVRGNDCRRVVRGARRVTSHESNKHCPSIARALPDRCPSIARTLPCHCST
eukprot:10533053-Lingulodinium_polyedra.AAC.1